MKAKLKDFLSKLLSRFYPVTEQFFGVEVDFKNEKDEKIRVFVHRTAFFGYLLEVTEHRMVDGNEEPFTYWIRRSRVKKVYRATA